jgi:hypothetical protein
MALANFYKNFEANSEETIGSLEYNITDIKDKYNNLIGRAEFVHNGQEWVVGENGKGLSMALFYFAASKGLPIPEDYQNYDWEIHWYVKDCICDSIQRQDIGGVFS